MTVRVKALPLDDNPPAVSAQAAALAPLPPAR
jgi:hypothetical protein